MKLLSYLGTIAWLLLSTTSVFAQQACIGGIVDNGNSDNEYPCDQINLQSHMTLSELGATGDGNDIWGWTDLMTGKEYALIGLNNGTAFIDMSDPVNPIRLGNLPTRSSNSDWRDIKVVGNYAYIVSEAFNHGLQVFDLTRLKNVINPPVTFDEDGEMNFGSSKTAHNIVANEEAGFVYLVGTNSYGSGGISTVNISDPTNPFVESNYGSDGYTHDAICVQYRGPDQEHIGKELCIGLNENEFVVLDMTDKDNIVRLSKKSYAGASYVHQGWLTDDHRYLLIDDETDESSSQNTRTHIFDMLNLESPVYLGFFENSTEAIDHNLYIKGRYAYQANYRSGLRVIDLEDIANGNLSEKAFFDVYPSSDSRGYTGSWSNYPYFKSGNIILSSIDRGLFTVKPTFPHYVFTLNYPTIIHIRPGETKQFTVDYNEYGGFSNIVSLSVENVPMSELTASTDVATISADGKITVTVTANSNANEQNYSLILKGSDPSQNFIETIALGLVISGDPIPVCNEQEVVNNNPNDILSGTYSASISLTSDGTIEEDSVVVFEAGQEIILKPNFIAKFNSTFTARIQTCPATIKQVETTKLPSQAVAPTYKHTPALKVFPNPFNEQLNVTLTLKEENNIELHLHDLTGKRIKTIIQSRIQSAGNHHFQLNDSTLESGFYILTIRIGENWQAKKVSIVK